MPLGVFEGGSGQVFADNLGDFVAATGREPDVVHVFTDWAPKPFPAGNVATITDHGAVPLITWEPRRWSGDPITDPLGRILSGVDDDHITSWGRSAKAYGRPLYLRFAHEMNGNWYPWGRLAPNTADEYVAAYRHVHDLVVAAGGDNVRWVWGPNTIDSPSLEARAYYPGKAYVDVVGLDGYNWGTERADTRWRSFGTIFSSTIDSIRTYADEPVWITETGSTEVGGDKAAWLRDMFATVAADDRYAAIIYFDAPGTGDWPLSTSQTATAAYRLGAADLDARLAADAADAAPPELSAPSQLEDMVGFEELPATPPAPAATEPGTRPVAVSIAPVKPAPAIRPTLRAQQRRAHTRRARVVVARGKAGVQPSISVQRRVGARWRTLRRVRTHGGVYRVRLRMPRHRVVLRAVATGLTSAPLTLRVR